ncbi:hypothetical protein [Magnetospirillum sp. SS-4]|uniref:hypothetical protein n=1 Tax=Magnetospirillum sp. SS-4 TaxID=2681465 RepID=UPI001572AB18|nr:hypothetical protein [Magnetospirillum sp. SS-4]
MVTPVWLRSSRKSRKVRLDIDEVTCLFRQVHPEAADEWDARLRLLEALKAMDGSVIKLPDTSTWDGKRTPALPRTIRILGNQKAVPIKRARAWAPELQDLQDWVGSLRNPITLSALEAINEWIIRYRDQDLQLVPTPERSLQIFGDEKRLDQLRAGDAALFGGRLSLARLGTYVTPLPLIYQRGERPGPMRVVENLASYESFRHWNADAYSGHPFGAVVWGEGNKILALTAGLLECASRLHCDTVFYVGDLDPEGLVFLTDLCEWGRSVNLLVRPHTAAYRFLLDHGHRAPFVRTRDVRFADLVGHFPKEMREEISTLVRSGHRIAQEALGTEALYRTGNEIFQRGTP